MQSNISSASLPVVKSPLIRAIARLISYIFHPIFIPVYAIAFLIYVHPSFFSGFSEANKLRTLIITILNLVFFPLVSVGLLKGLGFIDSIFLKTSKDRIIPYIACGIFFFWAYTVFKGQEIYPLILSSFVLGIFLASSAALIANIYLKISMHAIGAGGLVGLFIIIMRSNSMLMTWPLACALLIAGLVCTSRLILGDHNEKEIYLGLVVGIISQFISAYIIL